MARPPLDPDRKRVRKVDTRFTESEFEEVSRKAAAAGVTVSTYLRETVLGRRPKARPLADRALQELAYELTSLGANFTQLYERTDEETYAQWARYVGGELVERCARHPERAPLFADHIERINAVGHGLNRLARLANLGKPVDPGEMDAVLKDLKAALDPIHKAVSGNPDRADTAQDRD